MKPRAKVKTSAAFEMTGIAKVARNVPFDISKHSSESLPSWFLESSNTINIDYTIQYIAPTYV